MQLATRSGARVTAVVGNAERARVLDGLGARYRLNKSIAPTPSARAGSSAAGIEAGNRQQELRGCDLASLQVDDGLRDHDCWLVRRIEWTAALPQLFAADVLGVSG